MSEYASIFDPIPWQAVGVAALQTFVIYWLVILGLKIVGRRVFGQLGPQEIIVLLLISEATDIGLTPDDSGFWGTVAAVLVILVTGWLIEHIPPLKQFIEDSKVIIFDQGQPLRDVMAKNLVDDADLDSTARKYGFADASVFETMALESDGSISGVLKPEFRPPQKSIEITENNF